MAEAPLPEITRPPVTGPLALLRGAPTAGSLGLLAALIGLYGLAILATGEADGLLDAEAPLHLLRGFRFNLVLSVLLAFAVWAWFADPPSVAADLAALRSHLEVAPDELEARWRRLRDERFASAWGFAAGGSFGVAIVIVSERASYGSWSGWGWDVHAWWVVTLMFALFGTMGANAVASVRTLLLFDELGRHVRVRLLSLEPLRVFARRGLRTARFWFIGSAIAVLLVLSAGQPAVVVAVIVGTVGLGVASLVIPCLGVHRRLRQVKHAELARVRDAIERRGAALLEGRRAPEEDPDLPALLAYEARIQAVSEWPFDSPMLVRFLLLVLIPIASWVGGALVERLVDTALR